MSTRRRTSLRPPLFAITHSQRFRKVSNRYPRRVAEAYGGDIERAARDDDATVAATVAAWEAAHGLQVQDWYALGRDERAEGEGPYVLLSSPK